MTHNDEASDGGLCLCGECDAGTDRIGAERIALAFTEMAKYPSVMEWYASWGSRSANSLSFDSRGQSSFAWLSPGS